MGGELVVGSERAKTEKITGQTENITGQLKGLVGQIRSEAQHQQSPAVADVLNYFVDVGLTQQLSGAIRRAISSGKSERVQIINQSAIRAELWGTSPNAIRDAFTLLRSLISGFQLNFDGQNVRLDSLLQVNLDEDGQTIIVDVEIPERLKNMLALVKDPPGADGVSPVAAAVPSAAGVFSAAPPDEKASAAQVAVAERPEEQPVSAAQAGSAAQDEPVAALAQAAQATPVVEPAAQEQAPSQPNTLSELLQTQEFLVANGKDRLTRIISWITDHSDYMLGKSAASSYLDSLDKLLQGVLQMQTKFTREEGLRAAIVEIMKSADVQQQVAEKYASQYTSAQGGVVEKMKTVLGGLDALLPLAGDISADNSEIKLGILLEVFNQIKNEMVGTTSDGKSKTWENAKNLIVSRLLTTNNRATLPRLYGKDVGRFVETAIDQLTPQQMNKLQARFSAST